MADEEDRRGSSALLSEPAAVPEIDWTRPVKFLYLLGLLDRGIEREVRTRLAPFDLSPPEYQALALLHTVPNLSNAEMARRSLVTPQSMNEVIARLERRGLLSRHQRPDHGRIRLTEVTAAGVELVEPAMREIGALEAELLADIPADELPVVRAHLLGVLSRLRSL